MTNAKVTYVQGLQFVETASSCHAIVMDGNKRLVDIILKANGAASSGDRRMFRNGCCLDPQKEETGSNRF